MDNRITNSPDQFIIASSILVKNNSFPVRIVLYKKDDQYITHEQLLITENDPVTNCRFRHRCYYNGNYFRIEEYTNENKALHEAQNDYKERVRKLFFTG